jgi:hypothetical protein
LLVPSGLDEKPFFELMLNRPATALLRRRKGAEEKRRT